MQSVTSETAIDTAPQAQTGAPVAVALYTVFLVSLLVDIGGAFGIKYATFAILLLYLAVRSLRLQLSIPLSFVLVEGLLFLLAPVFFLFLAMAVFAVPPADALQHLTPFPIWLVYPLLIEMRSRDRILSIYTRTMLAGAVLTVIMFGLLVALFLSGKVGVIAAINHFTDSHRLGFFGARPLGDHTFTFFPNVYFRWTLLLLPAALLAFFRVRTGQFMLFAAGILATVSTAAILFLFLGVLWVAIEFYMRGASRRLYVRKALVLVLGVLLLAGALYSSGRGEIVSFALSKLSSRSMSTSIKLEHIHSIVTLLSNSIWTLLFGMGVGSSFYTTGTHSVVQYVEVSHFELVRQFGLLYASAFFLYCFALFVVVGRVDSLGKVLAISMLCLFLAAGTNPLLISPVFFLILAISRAYITLAAHQKPGPTSEPA